MDSFFTDCDTASVAVQTAAVAVTAAALAVTAFCLAYVTKTVASWRTWAGSKAPPADDA